MTKGLAKRIAIANVKQLASVITDLKSNQAIALGSLRADLPDQVKVVTKSNTSAPEQRDVIARTSANIVFRLGLPAYVLFDFDQKGMPAAVATAIERQGGFWPALTSVLPELQGVAHVTRLSTSAGLSRSDTGEMFTGSGGLHVYVVVEDGVDIGRFIAALHDRCWLAGFGWMMVGAGGQLLERSIIDRSVGGPERLVFEGDPILKSPLKQDRKSRRAIATDGVALDTVATCPPLTIFEKSRLGELKAKVAHQLESASAKARTIFVERQAKRIVKRTGMSIDEAERVVFRQCEGVLRPDVVLLFDDTDFAGCTVANVLADPGRFDGATLADPIEGLDYGRCKAKIMLRSDGTPWIHSFAHGRTIYELKLDAAAVRAAMSKAEKDAVVRKFIELVPVADLDAQEVEELRNEAAILSGIPKRTISAMLKDATKKIDEDRAIHTRKRLEAERTDPRPVFRAPSLDAPWLPEIETLNRVIGSSKSKIPPARDIDGAMTSIRKISVPGTHAFTSSNSNQDGE